MPATPKRNFSFSSWLEDVTQLNNGPEKLARSILGFLLFFIVEFLVATFWWKFFICIAFLMCVSYLAWIKLGNVSKRYRIGLIFIADIIFISIFRNQLIKLYRSEHSVAIVSVEKSASFNPNPLLNKIRNKKEDGRPILSIPLNNVSVESIRAEARFRGYIYDIGKQPGRIIKSRAIIGAFKNYFNGSRNIGVFSYQLNDMIEANEFTDIYPEIPVPFSIPVDKGKVVDAINGKPLSLIDELDYCEFAKLHPRCWTLHVNYIYHEKNGVYDISSAKNYTIDWKEYHAGADIFNVMTKR